MLYVFFNKNKNTENFYYKSDGKINDTFYETQIFKDNKLLDNLANDKLEQNEFDFNYELINKNNNNLIDFVDYNKIDTSNKSKMLDNMNTWYSNKWIEYIDDNGNPVYNSSDNSIYNSEIIVNRDIENLKSDDINSADLIGKPIKYIYDSLIDDYKY
jgi:hypothetical protein